MKFRNLCGFFALPISILACSHADTSPASADQDVTSSGTPASPTAPPAVAAAAAPAAEPASSAAAGDLQGGDRKAFLDAVRAEFFRQVGRQTPGVEFAVSSLKVRSGSDGSPFGFLEARPVKPGTIDDYDYHGTPIQGDIDAGLFDGNKAFATLKKVAGTWIVLQLDLGPTDVPWVSLHCDFDVPLEILPGADAQCDGGDAPSPLRAGEYTLDTDSIGGSLKILVASPRAAVLDLGVLGKTGSQHNGEIDDGTARFDESKGAYELDVADDCHFTMKAVPAGIEVAQEGTCTDAGFGAFLDASGTYRAK